MNYVEFFFKKKIIDKKNLTKFSYLLMWQIDSGK